LEDKQVAVDGTTKAVFRFHDGKVAEGVYIPSSSRVTACVSAQTGCSLNCAFCATGRLHKNRNLTAGEIYDQVFEIKKMAEENDDNLTNIVYMGMGEPLLNYENVLESINRVTGKPGLEMSPSRITVIHCWNSAWY
jgi:23S rRNA (adenine2503-C2)-methyltransferase